MQDPKKIFFLCDGEVPECKKTMCYKNANNNPCRWTSDIKHAKNFKDHRENGTYYEEKYESKTVKMSDYEIPYMGKNPETVIVDGIQIPSYQNFWETTTKIEGRIGRLCKVTILLSIAVGAMALTLILK